MRAGVPRGSSRALSRASCRIGHVTKAYAQVGGGVKMAPSPVWPPAPMWLRGAPTVPRRGSSNPDPVLRLDLEDRRAALLRVVAVHGAARVGSAVRAELAGLGSKEFAVIPRQRARTVAASRGWLPMSPRADRQEAG